MGCCNVKINVKTNPIKLNISTKLMVTGKQSYPITVELEMADGDQKIIPDEGKVFSQVTVKKPETLIPDNIRNGTEIGGVIGTMLPIDPSYKGFVEGTLEEWSAPKVGATKIIPYAFQNQQQLKKLDLTGITEIPNFMCNGCSGLETIDINNVQKINDRAFLGCNNLQINELSNSINYIGDYAFRVSNYNKNLIINDFHPVDVCELSANAFSVRPIRNLRGKFILNGASPFSNWAQVDKIENFDISFTSNYLYAYSMFTFPKVVNFNIRRGTVLPDSTQSSYLQNYFTVRHYGSQYADTTPYFDIDLRDSLFTKSGNYMFSQTARYKVRFPKTLTNVRGTEFYDAHFARIFFTSIPTLESPLSSFNHDPTYAYGNKLYFLYNDVASARVATNWATYASIIYGWAEEDTFKSGDTLPTTDSNGNTLTWFSDFDLTNEVTTVEDGSQIYYCKVGA